MIQLPSVSNTGFVKGRTGLVKERREAIHARESARFPERSVACAKNAF
jgi:hypothetical protein